MGNVTGGRRGVHIVVALHAALTTKRLRGYLRIYAGIMLWTRRNLIVVDTVLAVRA